jgi:two-component system, OmpR family, sensor histidine kinase KdpD
VTSRGLGSQRELGRGAVGLAVAAAAIALATLLLYPLREVAPAVSLGVVYLLVVLLVASIWGVWVGVLTAVVAAAAFNFFHIPSTGRFTIAEAENWVALGVFFLAAVLAAELAQRARQRAEEAERRRREADLSAEMARLLLRGDAVSDSLATVAQRIAQALGLGWATIELGVREPGEDGLGFPLGDGPAQLATLIVPRDTAEPALRRLEERVVPSLEALLAAAVEREELLSDRVEAAALRRTDVLKTALLRSVSHDLRSPLTAIRAAAEPLRAGNLEPGERSEMASVVIEEAMRLSRLIDKLLDLSRLEAGATEPRFTACDVAEVIHAAVDELRPPIEAFRLQLADDMPEVEADPVQLQRAVANVLENAHHHSGGLPVMVRASALHDRVVIRVVDRGPGIPSAERERVFEPFFRSNDDRTAHRGSGLGLAIARGFVEGNSGRIWVESTPGQGTTFVLEFPIEPSGPSLAPNRFDQSTARV